MILATLMAASAAPVARSFALDKPEKTLYQRMGGYDVIAGIVDDFIGQLRKDPAFQRFGGGRSHDSLLRTRQLVVDQICFLAGGPCVYIGRDTKTVHAGLAITDAEWDASIKMFKNSLDKFKVAEMEQQEFLDMIGKLKSDIVESPKPYAPKAQN